MGHDLPCSPPTRPFDPPHPSPPSSLVVLPAPTSATSLQTLLLHPESASFSFRSLLRTPALRPRWRALKSLAEVGSMPSPPFMPSPATGPQQAPGGGSWTAGSPFVLPPPQPLPSQVTATSGASGATAAGAAASDRTAGLRSGGGSGGATATASGAGPGSWATGSPPLGPTPPKCASQWAFVYDVELRTGMPLCFLPLRGC